MNFTFDNSQIIVKVKISKLQVLIVSFLIPFHYGNAWNSDYRASSKL